MASFVPGQDARASEYLGFETLLQIKNLTASEQVEEKLMSLFNLQDQPLLVEELINLNFDLIVPLHGGIVPTSMTPAREVERQTPNVEKVEKKKKKKTE